MTVETTTASDDGTVGTEDVKAALSGAKTKKERKGKGKAMAADGVQAEIKERIANVTKTRVSRAPLPSGAVIRMAKDANGNPFGPDNLPCRPGTLRGSRFSRVFDGMTLPEAADNDLPNGQVRQYVARGWVTLEDADGEPIILEDNTADSDETEETEQQAA